MYAKIIFLGSVSFMAGIYILLILLSSRKIKNLTLLAFPNSFGDLPLLLRCALCVVFLSLG